MTATIVSERILNTQMAEQAVIEGLTFLIQAALRRQGQEETAPGPNADVMDEIIKDMRIRSTELRDMREVFENLMAGVVDTTPPPLSLPVPVPADLRERHQALYTACIPNATEAQAFAALHNWLVTGGDFPAGPILKPAEEYFKRIQNRLEYITQPQARANGG